MILTIARALRDIAALLQLAGGSPYKVRAYERGATVVEQRAGDLAELIERRQLKSVDGIGDSLAQTINQLWTTGGSELLDRLRGEFPPSIVELIGIPHLSIARLTTLHRALGIASRAELKAACESGRVRALAGFGPKIEEKILAGLAPVERGEERLLLSTALAELTPLLRHLRGAAAVRAVSPAGEVRRCCETVARLEIVAASSAPARAVDHFAANPRGLEVVSRTSNAAVVRLAGGPLAALHVVRPPAFATALFHHSGAGAHVEKVAARAGARGSRLADDGLWNAAGRRLRIRDEAELYRQVDLQPIPPELREDAGEIEAAARGELPVDLVELADLRGITHAHTRYSDGKNTVAEMARAAEAIGVEYLTITDHSESATYAHGVERDRLRRQWDEIARVQEQVGIRLLRGTEADILADGALDYPIALLEQLDVVIASIHSRHSMNAAEMTGRIEQAMRVPLFKIWGHPLGRLLNRRAPIDCDVERILDAIAAAPAAIEINGDPRRLDLEPRWIRAARARGIRFILSPDAHSTASLRNVRFAVAMARRGWVRRGEVLNTLPADAFRAAVRPQLGTGS